MIMRGDYKIVKIEIDLKGVEGNEEITKAVVEKIQNSPQVEGLDKAINNIVHNYMVERAINNLQYSISNNEVRDTYKEICREKVTEFCNVAFEKDREFLEQEVTKISDSIKNQMADIFINTMFNMFVGKMQQQDWDMRWNIINQVKDDIRNGRI
jgi:hypothetical protein